MMVSTSSKLTQIAATMVCLTHAQWTQDLKGGLEANAEVENEWGDLQNFTETIEITEDKTVQNGTGKNNCFQVSQIKGNDDDADFLSDLSKLKSSFLDGMKISRIRICGTDTDFRGVQGFVSDGLQTIALTPFGSQFQCADWDVDEDSFIKRVVVTYTEAKGVKHLQILDQKGLNIERGRNSINVSDLAYEVEFTQYEPLSGFVGYEDTTVKAIGFYRYRCMTRPEDNTGVPGETTGGEGSGENTTGEGEGTGTGEESEGTGTGDNSGGNTQTGGDDKPLDGETTRENNKGDKDTLTELNVKNSEILDEQDEDSSLQMILIILVCVLVPLIIVLASIVYLFRKNKKNAISAAALRRSSSIRLQATLDEKMEAKGGVDIFADDKKQGTGILGAAFMGSVPTDDEINELMKGKTATEKKVFLKEIEKARQAKIHMTYLMEQQKLKNDERWAVRNVEERQAVLKLYNNNVEAVASVSKNKEEIVEEESKGGSGELYQSERSGEKDITGEPIYSPTNKGGLDEEDPKIDQGILPAIRQVFPNIHSQAVSDQYVQQYKEEEDFEVAAPPIPGFSSPQDINQNQASDLFMNGGPREREGTYKQAPSQDIDGGPQDDFDFE